MEVSPCAQVVRNHTTSLLLSLNVQRLQAQFCDCVVRTRQSPGQLYPAHRCVLAASSPVLASILSSTGALVELQETCLSGTVLALLLDFIYTGTLPHSGVQQYYSGLLSAACHLQMDGLQEALRAWQQAKASDAEETSATTRTERQPYTDILYTCSEHLLSTCSVDAFKRRDETDICSVQSAASSLEREDHRYSAASGTWNEAQLHSVSMESCAKGRGTCGASSVNGCSRKDVRTARGISQESTDSVHEIDSTRVMYPTPLDLIQNVPCTAGVRGVSEEDKEVPKDRFHSTGTVKPETWQKSRGNELVRTVGDSMDSSSSSSPLPCCGAVPVICHSSRAAVHQPTAMSSVTPSHAVSDATVCVPQSTGTEHHNIVEGNRTKPPKNHRTQSHHDRDDKYHTRTQSWDFQNSSAQRSCYKSSTERCDVTSGSADYSMKHNDGHVNNGLSHITDHNNQHDHCDSFQNKKHTKHLRDNSASLKFRSNFIRSLRNKTELRFDDSPPKLRRLDWPDGPDVSRRSQDLRAVLPLPVEMSDTGSDSHREELCPEGEANGNISEPHLSPPMPVDRTGSDPMYSVIKQPYPGQLYYHCLPQEDTHLLHGDTDHKHFHPRHPDYSDQSNVEKETGTFASTGHTSLGQHFAPGRTDRVVLLDISGTPAELLVSYRNRSDGGEKDITYCKNATFVTGVRDNVVERGNEATGLEEKQNSESFGERETRSWVGETNEEGGDQSKPGADVVRKARVVEELSNPAEGENQSSTLPVCSPPSVPDRVPASVSSTLSGCTPCTLSASMSGSRSAHLSPPLQHPFQCSQCDRSFSQRGSLNRHVRSHLGVRPFPCPCCPMTFSRQYRVTEHMRVHQRCPQGNDFHKPPASSV